MNTNTTPSSAVYTVPVSAAPVSAKKSTPRKPRKKIETPATEPIMKAAPTPSEIVENFFSPSLYAILWTLLLVVPYTCFVTATFKLLGFATACFALGVFVLPIAIFSALAYVAGLQIIIRYAKANRREYISIFNLFWSAHFSHDESWLKKQTEKIIELNAIEEAKLIEASAPKRFYKKAS